MKPILTLFCILTSFLSLNAQSNAELGVGAMGLVVSDIEASEEFYTKILGLTPIGGFSLDEQWSKEAGAANNKAFSVKQFKLQDKPSGTIVKLAYFKDAPKTAKKSGINSSTGVNYITLYYTAEAFQKTISRIKEAQIEIVGWVKRDTYQLVFVRDPDGVFVELVAPPQK